MAQVNVKQYKKNQSKTKLEITFKKVFCMPAQNAKASFCLIQHPFEK